jgi:hypothetical protein
MEVFSEDCVKFQKMDRIHRLIEGFNVILEINLN